MARGQFAKAVERSLKQTKRQARWEDHKDRCNVLTLEEDFALEHETGGIANLLRIWREIEKPSERYRDLLDPIRLYQTGLSGWIHILDVSSINPAGFMFVTYAPKVDTLDGEKSFLFKPLGSYKAVAWKDSLISEYNLIKCEGLPRYQLVWGRRDGTRRGYARLSLPLGEKFGQVDKVLVAVRVQDFSFFT